jgi:uncharacterized protein YjeT (DUF2065 family)
MQWTDLLAAVALVFVLEGMLPFLSPDTYKRMMRMVTEMDDRSLRVMGVVSMLIGLGLLAVVR